MVLLDTPLSGAAVSRMKQTSWIWATQWGYICCHNFLILIFSQIHQIIAGIVMFAVIICRSSSTRGETSSYNQSFIKGSGLCLTLVGKMVVDILNYWTPSDLLLSALATIIMILSRISHLTSFIHSSAHHYSGLCTEVCNNELPMMFCHVKNQNPWFTFYNLTQFCFTFF